MKKSTIIWTVILILGLVLSVWAPAQAEEEEAEVFRVGLLGPITGPFGTFGEMMVEGATLAFEEYDYTIAGHPIELFPEDTRLDNEIAVSKAKKLDEQDNVHVILGPVSGAEGLSVLDWAKDSGVPLIVTYSAPEDITMRLAVRNVTRNSWTGAQPMDPFGYWVATELGYKRIYMIGEDYSYPYNQIGGFKRGFCRGGGEEVTTVWHPVGAEDYSSYIAAIPREGYDAVLYNGAGSDAVAFVKQYVEFGMLDVYPLLGQSNTYESGDLPAMPHDIVGQLSAIQYVETLDTPEFEKFAEAYEAAYGRVPSAVAEHAYTAAIMALRAVEAIEGNIDDRDAFIDALRATDYPDAPRGPFYLDEFANPVHNIYIREVREVDGVLKNFGLVKVPMVSQFGLYDPELYMAQPPDARDYPSDKCSEIPPEMLEVEGEYEFIPYEEWLKSR